MVETESRTYKYVYKQGRVRKGRFSELPHSWASEKTLQKYLARRSYEAAKGNFNREERALVVASTTAAVEATQYAQDTVPAFRFIKRARKQKSLYGALLHAGLNVAHAFDGAFDEKKGNLVADAAEVEKAFKAGVANKPKEVNQTQAGDVAKAAEAVDSKNGQPFSNAEVVKMVSELGLADMVSITDDVLRRRFHLPEFPSMTNKEVFAVLQNPLVVDMDDRSRQKGRWGGLDKANPDEPFNAHALSSSQREAVRAALLLGHVDWGIAQVYKAIKDNSLGKVDVYGLNGDRLTQVMPTGKIRRLSDDEVNKKFVEKDGSVSYNPLDTTIAATYVKFVTKLQAAGYTGDLVTAARLRTAFEIIKDAAQFEKPKADPKDTKGYK